MPHLNRLVFMGTPAFAVPVLQALASEFHQAQIAVVTVPDAPSGRGKVMTPTPVSQAAEALGFPVHKAGTKAEVATVIDAVSPDLVVVVAYGVILPKSVTDLTYCVNIHASILPKYRGASPIHSALLNGDLNSGITLIRMNERMDQGPILAIHRLPIPPTATLGSLHDLLASLGAQAIVRFIRDQWLPSHFTETPQDEAQATYCHKLEKSDTELLPTDSITVKLGKIRAFSPVPGAFTWQNGRRVKILSAIEIDGRLLPDHVKPEGKGEMSYSEFVRGYGELTI